MSHRRVVDLNKVLLAEHKYYIVVWLGLIKAAKLVEGRVRFVCVCVCVCVLYKVGTVVP